MCPPETTCPVLSCPEPETCPPQVTCPEITCPPQITCPEPTPCPTTEAPTTQAPCPTIAPLETCGELEFRVGVMKCCFHENSSTYDIVQVENDCPDYAFCNNEMYDTSVKQCCGEVDGLVSVDSICPTTTAEPTTA